MTAETVPVVIPTLNSIGTIEQCLLSIRANRGPYVCEIIVVDAKSTDGTIEAARALADRVIVEEDCSIGASRNIGIRNSTGSIICFTDSDCAVPENWIEALVENLRRLNSADGRIVGVGGGNVPLLESPSLVELAISRTMRSPLVAFGARNVTVYRRERPVWHNPPVNSAYFRWALEEVGGFGERRGRSEDLELDVKLAERGYLLYYVPGLDVRHKHRSSPAAYARQMRDWGRKRVRLQRDYPRVRSLYHYGPLMLFLMLYSPLFFVPVLMALANATYLGLRSTSVRLSGRAFLLTLSFYRNFGLGEAEAVFKER